MFFYALIFTHILKLAFKLIIFSLLYTDISTNSLFK